MLRGASVVKSLDEHLRQLFKSDSHHLRFTEGVHESKRPLENQILT